MPDDDAENDGILYQAHKYSMKAGFNLRAQAKSPRHMYKRHLNHSDFSYHHFTSEDGEDLVDTEPNTPRHQTERNTELFASACVLMSPRKAFTNFNARYDVSFTDGDHLSSKLHPYGRLQEQLNRIGTSIDPVPPSNSGSLTIPRLIDEKEVAEALMDSQLHQAPRQLQSLQVPPNVDQENKRKAQKIESLEETLGTIQKEDVQVKTKDKETLMEHIPTWPGAVKQEKAPKRKRSVAPINEGPKRQKLATVGLRGIEGLNLSRLTRSNRCHIGDGSEVLDYVTSIIGVLSTYVP
ncbi:hypothetical protein HRG_012275 [Hirsutella rhossiliensis]